MERAPGVGGIGSAVGTSLRQAVGCGCSETVPGVVGHEGALVRKAVWQEHGAVAAVRSAFLLSTSMLVNHGSALGAAGEGQRSEVEVAVRRGVLGSLLGLGHLSNTQGSWHEVGARDGCGAGLHLQQVLGWVEGAGQVPGAGYLYGQLRPAAFLLLFQERQNLSCKHTQARAPAPSGRVRGDPIDLQGCRGGFMANGTVGSAALCHAGWDAGPVGNVRPGKSQYDGGKYWTPCLRVLHPPVWAAPSRPPRPSWRECGRRYLWLAVNKLPMKES